MILDLNMFYEKMTDFILFPLFRFTLIIKLRNFDIESYLNTLILFKKKIYDARFQYIP